MNDLLQGILGRHGKTPYLTLGLIACCLLIALLSNFGNNLQALLPLLMSEYRSNQLDALVEIQQGQYWRLVTPILLHFGFLHLLFNSMWLWDLGGFIETRWSALKLLFLLLVIGLISNLAQYLVSGPLFGGLSGVVYGLLAYLFCLGRLKPQTGVQVSPAIMNFMLLWFALCWTGLLGNIANWAHAAGLLCGALIAFIEAQLMPR